MKYLKRYIQYMIFWIFIFHLISPGKGESNSNLSSNPVILQNNQWKISIQPDRFSINAVMEKNKIIPLSIPTDKTRNIKDLSVSDNELQWYYPDQKINIRLQLEKDYLSIYFSAQDTGKFQLPVIPILESLKALIWPHNEGYYIPVTDEIWMEHLKNQYWNTLEGLSMPFWGMEYEDYILTYIITNPFNNRISFNQKENSIQLIFEHEIPPNGAEKEFGFEIHLSKNDSPIIPAKIFRNYLIRQNQFVTLKEKMKKVPKVERLLGAPHAYLWGGDIFTRHDIPKNKWPAFCKRLIEESSSDKPSLGKNIKSLIEKSRWKQIEELAKEPNAYLYIMNEIFMGISEILTKRELTEGILDAKFPTPSEARELLKKGIDILTLPELIRLNSLIFQTAYSDFLLDVDSWGDGVSIKMMNTLQKAGIEKMMFCVDGWEQIEKKPDIARKADEMGYLLGTYDSYHSIHDPKLKGTDSTWSTAQFDQFLYETGGITNQFGKKLKGFKQQGYKLSPIAVRPYLEKRISENMKNVPYSYYFIDCDAFGEYYDDYTPGRNITQREDVNERIDRLKWISDTFKVPIGSEGGNYMFAPVLHVTEGIFTSVIGWGDKDMKDKTSPYYIGRYYPPEGPEVFVKQVPLKDKYIHLNYDPRFKLPLYEIVFHDSLITSSHWSSGSLKFSNVWKTNTLTEMLYQVPPLYHLNLDLFKKYEKIIKKHYDYFSPLHKETALLPMTDFQWLTGDRVVQKTVFGNQIEIIANFSDKPFLFNKTSIPSNSIFYRDNNQQIKIYTP